VKALQRVIYLFATRGQVDALLFCIDVVTRIDVFDVFIYHVLPSFALLFSVTYLTATRGQVDALEERDVNPKVQHRGHDTEL
jgi:hypothetical protein